MKRIILFVILFITSLAGIAQSITRFEVSKAYAVLNFMETAAGTGAGSSTLKSFIKSRIPAGDSIFRQLVKDFRNIPLHYNYTIDEYPDSRRQQRSTYDLMVIAAVKSTSLTAFQDNSIGIIPNSLHADLFRILNEAEHYYDRIIWNEYQAPLAGQVTALKQYEPKANVLFQQFKQFYNSGWSDNIPFHITLVPIPGSSGSSTATPHANSLCVGVLTGKKDYLGTMAVAMHEMCHVLYDEQRSAFQHHLDSAFKTSTSPYRNTAYDFFDEALATALGNGWAYQYIAGHVDTTAWYNNTYIDGFAHAIYPMVVDYLEHKKTIDPAFINKAIDLFGKTFPNALTDYSILLNNMYFYADAETEEERQTLKGTLHSYFQSSRYNFSSPVLHAYSLKHLRTAPQTQLIIIDNDHATTLQGLEKIFPQLKGLLKGRKDPDYVLSFFDAAKRPVVIVYLKDKSKLDKAFQLMRKEQFIQADKPYSPVH